MAGPVETRLGFARMIVQRLERLSADSAWAHIASGYRGSLIKNMEQLEHLANPELASDDDLELLEFLIAKGLDLLARAAREIGDPELIRFSAGLPPRP